ncbi:MAG: hypothetical protein HUJ72_06515, partial [Blautia sp.]|nr:hypothetical protein [Blautia sp.]
RYANARVIHRAIPEISTVFIWSSLHMMKWITNAMICNDNERKRKWIGGISSLAGRKAGRFVKDYFMKREMDAKDLPYVQEGLKLYEKALDKAAEELQELFMLSKAETYLSERWALNYKGI